MLLANDSRDVLCSSSGGVGRDGARNNLIRPGDSHEATLDGRERRDDNIVLVLPERVGPFLLQHADHGEWLVLDTDGLPDWIDAFAKEIRRDRLAENADLRAVLCIGIGKIASANDRPIAYSEIIGGAAINAGGPVRISGDDL